VNEFDRALWLDFETTSLCDLPSEGLDRYLNDPTTRPTCFTYRLPNMTQTALWEFGQPLPADVLAHIKFGGEFWAHNAPFDFHIWNTVLSAYCPELPQIKIEQVRCTAFRARYNGLPGSLEGACDAMGLPIRKDVAGGKVMKEIAKHPDWTPQTHPAEFARMYQYAVTDTDAMIGLARATQPVPAREQAFFELDMKINARGFGADVEAARCMEELKTLAEAQLDYQITVLTKGGVLAVTEIAKIKEFATNYDIDMDDASKEAIKTLTKRDDLPSDLREVLALRLDASRAPKKSAAIVRAHVGGRIRHSTIPYGALSGRSTARGAGGVQLLNIARPRPGKSVEQCEAFIDAIKRKDVAYLSAPEHGPMLAALADAQRPLFRATWPGHTLVDADLSGIEARLGPWIANDEDMLTEFERNIDGYKVEASSIFDIAYEEVTKDQRQIGKVVRLALQYGGGAGAFVSMAGNYGVHLPSEQVDDIVYKYRAGHPMLERWWSVLEYCALIALDQPGREVEMPIGRGFCSKVVFVRDDTALRMRLPSGRAISYHNARLHLDPGASAPVAIYDKPEGYVETLDRKILSNNMTQGLARDFFWEIMLDVEQAERIVHHVYDQIVMEVPKERAALRLEQLKDRMRIAPSWAPGLPLNAEGYTNDQWRKD